MSVIVPCLTVETEEQYKLLVEKYQNFAQRVQIDLSDGRFAPVFLLSPDKIWWPKDWLVDIHVMMSDPTEYIDKIINLKPHLIILHAESEVEIIPLLEKIKRYNIKTGVALLKQTVPETVSHIIKIVDHVLIFSGDLGHYGGNASLMQLEKVRLIKKIKPEVEIGWDGGVSLNNAFTLARGGINVLNVGGALAKSDDPLAVYNQLIIEINKQGII